MQLAWGRAGGQAAAGRRVAVTGLGVVVRCGIGKDAFWEGLCAPAPVGDRRITGFDPTAWFGPKEVRRVDRFAQLSVASAAMALASPTTSPLHPRRR